MGGLNGRDAIAGEVVAVARGPVGIAPGPDGAVPEEAIGPFGAWRGGIVFQPPRPPRGVKPPREDPKPRGPEGGMVGLATSTRACGPPGVPGSLDGVAVGDATGAVKFLVALGPVGALRAAGPRGGDLFETKLDSCCANLGGSRGGSALVAEDVGRGDRTRGDSGSERSSRPRADVGRGEERPEAEREVKAEEMFESLGGGECRR